MSCGGEGGKGNNVIEVFGSKEEEEGLVDMEMHHLAALPPTGIASSSRT
jgi:hypothetical protein